LSFSPLALGSSAKFFNLHIFSFLPHIQSKLHNNTPLFTNKSFSFIRIKLNLYFLNKVSNLYLDKKYDWKNEILLKKSIQLRFLGQKLVGEIINILRLQYELCEKKLPLCLVEWYKVITTMTSIMKCSKKYNCHSTICKWNHKKFYPNIVHTNLPEGTDVFLRIE